MYQSILDTIGNTPIVRLQRLAPPGIELYVKLESRNPGGSVKDRMAVAAIEDAEQRGVLRPGQTVVEATSGNTGIALAMVCAAKGYPLVVVMAENFSIERRRLMRLLGARVVLTPAALKGSGMLAKARELAAHLDGFLVEQFDNPANARAHELGTAREILASFAGRPLDCFVTGAGTGGTLRGVGAVLRKESPHTRIVVCEPDNAPVLASGRAQPQDGSSHPAFRPHLMQGWTPDFIPGLTAAAVAAGMIDHVQAVDGHEAIRVTHALAREEGILSGISGGAAVAGALHVCATLAPGSRVLVMLPDAADRYLSTPLFEDISDAMNDVELALSHATPFAHFGAAPVIHAPPTTGVQLQPSDAAADAAADAELDALLKDREQPVILFGFAWCEYAWAVRRLFAHLGVPYQAVILDAPDMQAGDRGGRLRRALARHLGKATIPQVFVGSQHIGGCNETFAAMADRSLLHKLAGAGVVVPKPSDDFDPTSLLPNWQQPTGESQPTTPAKADTPRTVEV
jgi:cysteine synthase A